MGWLLGASLLLGGCTQIQDALTRIPLPEKVEEVIHHEPEPDPVIGTKSYGTLPGRLIMDYAPRPVSEESGGETPSPEPSMNGEENRDEGDLSTEGDGMEEDGRMGQELDDTTPKAPVKTHWTDEEVEELLAPHDTPIDQLTEVGDYLIDYHAEGSWVREALAKDGDRYAHPMVETQIPEDLLVLGRNYFSYLTKINDALAEEDAFSEKELDLSLLYGYQYEGTENYILYYREYLPRTLLTTGNEGYVVLDKNGKLIHYLAFGRRNPAVLSFTPAYDQKTAEKRLWKLFNNRLHGYVDDYVLTDLYLKIPANGDYEKAPKALKPRWHAEFRSPLHSQTQTLLDPGK